MAGHSAVGDGVGTRDGGSVGRDVGALVGTPDGASVGWDVGVDVGTVDGTPEGCQVSHVGSAVGTLVGSGDGGVVGTAVRGWCLARAAAHVPWPVRRRRGLVPDVSERRRS